MLRVALRRGGKFAALQNCKSQLRLSPRVAAACCRGTEYRQSFHSSGCIMTETVPFTFIQPCGEEKEIQGEIGKNLLDIAHENDIELEGACGGELACATCHLIFEEEMFNTLSEKDEEEDDMLDLAFELTETSRLGCQICVRKDMAGMKVRIPDDGF